MRGRVDARVSIATPGRQLRAVRPSEELAEAIVSGLQAAGTRVVYGVPGGGNNLDVIGACEAAGLRFVLAHGETAAAIMASADAEITGLPGACVVTRGPGAASAVNGAAQALLDRTPVALITDAVPQQQRERTPHQRLDQRALLAPVTKWSGAIAAVDGAEASARALAHAIAPAPGPVHLDFVPDAAISDVPSPAAPGSARGTVDDVRRILERARRPVIALGVGARRHTTPLRRLLGDNPWPVLTTYKAKGIIPESWANAAGLLTGATVESPVLRAADVIVSIGVDPVELIPAPWPYAAKVVALGEWPMDDPYIVPDAELVGPLSELIDIVQDTLPRSFEGPVFGRVTRRAISERLMAAPAAGIGPQHVVLAARTAAPAETIATIDAGAHMLVAMPLWEVESPAEVMISSGLATMGYALPAAIAAAVIHPDRPVICFVGDGGLGMALAELETVSRLELPVCVVVFNDSALSLIEIKQAPRGQGGRNAVRYRPSDFAGIARSFGIAARHVTTRGDLAPAFEEALEERRPFLLDVRVDATAYPDIMATIRGGTRG